LNYGSLEAAKRKKMKMKKDMYLITEPSKFEQLMKTMSLDEESDDDLSFRLPTKMNYTSTCGTPENLSTDREVLSGN
jgi:hypothetical protein